MKTHFLLACAALMLPTSSPFHLKADDSGFEEPATLLASEILQSEYLSGPHHKVRESVPTYSGTNWYTIDSDYGVFEADGNALLVQRVAEINALARLRDISRTDEFAQALARAAKSPIGAAKNLITQPVKTVSAVPKGLWKMLNQAGQSAKEISQGRQRSEYEDKAAQDVLGVSKVKRELAMRLGVDPYSSNQELQRELNSVAWASFAGQSTINALTAAASGGASVTLTTAGVITRNEDRLRDSSPADLRRDNLALLGKMGIPHADSDALLNNPAFSPWTQTQFVTALADLDGVHGRADFVRTAAKVSDDESDAIFCAHTAELLRRLHTEGTRLHRIVIHRGYPVAIGADDSVIVAWQWDYAAWTPRAAAFVKDIEDLSLQDNTPRHIHVILTGDISPTLRTELETRGASVQDRAMPGPLK